MNCSILCKCITLLLYITLCSLSHSIHAQITGWIYFSDKGQEVWDPKSVFTEAAIERRSRLGIEFNELDKPISNNYLSAVNQYADSVHGVSKWLNGAVITCSEANWSAISKLKFVAKMDTTAYNGIAFMPCSYDSPKDTLSYSEIVSVETAKKQMQGDCFQSKNISGQNVIIAILDAGFKGVSSGSAFKNIREKNKIIATRDFINPRSKSIYAYSTHGARVLSCIAGETDTVSFGLGTSAKFILARVTPQFGGFRSLNDAQWIAALEWADEQGASLVNSSLSFTTQLFSRAEMDGVSARISKVAGSAAERGIVIVNSAGNEYDGDWEIIGAPADALDILTIGSISPFTFLQSNFSSIGPTADGRMKPDLCAIGELYVADEHFEFAQGTSFATPLVTGFVACVQELHPEWNAYEVMDAMRKSGHLHPYFDYAHGYGVPQASYFIKEQNIGDTTLHFLKKNFTHCELNASDSIHHELTFCFSDDSLVYRDYETIIENSDLGLSEQLNVYVSVLDEIGKLKSFGFNRLQAEFRNGTDSYRSEDEAPEDFDYFFGLMNLNLPKCETCSLRIHFLNEIINLPFSNE